MIVTGENNGLIARIYPDQDAVSAKRMNEETIRSELQAFIDSYNNTLTDLSSDYEVGYS